MLEAERGPQHVDAGHVKTLTGMGFREKAARTALAAAGDDLEGALEQLQVGLGSLLNGSRKGMSAQCSCCASSGGSADLAVVVACRQRNFA